MHPDYLTIVAAGSALILTLDACAAPPATTTPVLVTREIAAATNTPNLAAQESTTATVASGLAAQESATLEAGFNAPDLFREDSQGAVTVSVIPLNLDAPSDTLNFDVAMNTHSVDLSMDLAILATLESDTGLSVAPLIWDAPRGGHHVGGALTFPASVDGKPLLDGAATLTLTIRDVDVPERVFVWDLAP
jgi:hypothetical protein